MERPKIISLTGPTYGGKTSFGISLAALIGGTHLASDAITQEWRSAGRKMVPHPGRAINREHYRRIKAALDSGSTVVNDRLHLTRELRDEPRHFAEEQGVQHVLIYVRAPEEEIWKRWEANRRIRRRMHVRKDRVRRILDMYEPPDPAVEEHLVFRSGVDTLPEWFQKHANVLG